jgi:hypothetical protein
MSPSLGPRSSAPPSASSSRRHILTVQRKTAVGGSKSSVASSPTQNPKAPPRRRKPGCAALLHCISPLRVRPAASAGLSGRSRRPPPPQQRRRVSGVRCARASARACRKGANDGLSANLGRCSIAFRPSGCGPPLQRASPVVLAAHPRLGGALGPGLRRVVAGLVGSADQTRIEGGPTTASPRQRRPLCSEALEVGRALFEAMRSALRLAND